MVLSLRSDIFEIEGIEFVSCRDHLASFIKHVSVWVEKKVIKHPTYSPEYSKRRTDGPGPCSAQRVSCVRKFTKPLFTMLAAIALTFSYVSVNELDKLRNKEPEKLILQTSKQVLEVGSCGLVKIEVK